MHIVLLEGRGRIDLRDIERDADRRRREDRLKMGADGLEDHLAGSVARRLVATMANAHVHRDEGIVRMAVGDPVGLASRAARAQASDLEGFKLLAGVSEQELLDAVSAQMQSSGSDFVLANDLSGIVGDTHGAMLVGRDGILDRPGTKQEIAASIVRHVTQRAAG